MTPAWAQRQAALRSDCIVSSAVFDHMVDRLRDFVVPYQRVLETQAGQRNVYLYLQGLLSHLPGKNAEDIATLVEVERLVIQEFIGTALWDHRPLVHVLVGQVVERLGDPDGVIAFDPSSFPKRGTHSVGVKRPWCGHRGKVDNCQVGVYMGYVSRHDHALLDFRLSLPQEWARDEQRRQACHVPKEVQYHTRHDQCLEMRDRWRDQVPHGWVTGDDELGRHTRFRGELRERGERYVLGVPCTTTMRDLEAPSPVYQGRGRRPKAPWQSVRAWRQSLGSDGWTCLTVRDGEKVRWTSRWSSAAFRHGSSVNGRDPKSGWSSPGVPSRTTARWSPKHLGMLRIMTPATVIITTSPRLRHTRRCWRSWRGSSKLEPALKPAFKEARVKREWTSIRCAPCAVKAR